uniref:Uncharacterized protein n=1 Tax=Fagus sylvatica TaxID=28930 RepID=A0A2N9FYT4_FAGSY
MVFVGLLIMVNMFPFGMISGWEINPLRDVIQGPLALEESSFRICDLIEGASFWDFSKLSVVLPSSICAQIKSIYLCTLNHLEDCIVCDTVDGSFSLKEGLPACPVSLLIVWLVSVAPIDFGIP